MESDEENNAHAENGDDFPCEDIESEEGLVRELVKIKMYGAAKTLDEIVEVARKNARETKARIEKLNALLEDEQSQDDLVPATGHDPMSNSNDKYDQENGKCEPKNRNKQRRKRRSSSRKALQDEKVEN